MLLHYIREGRPETVTKILILTVSIVITQHKSYVLSVRALFASFKILQNDGILFCLFVSYRLWVFRFSWQCLINNQSWRGKGSQANPQNRQKPRASHVNFLAQTVSRSIQQRNSVKIV